MGNEAVELVNRFVYLGSTIGSSCSSQSEINKRLGTAGQLFRDMEKAIWRGKMSLQVKLRIYNACVPFVLLYAADTWSLQVGDEKRIDAFDMRCQRRILGVRWYDFVTNETIRQQTGLLP